MVRKLTEEQEAAALLAIEAAIGAVPVERVGSFEMLTRVMETFLTVIPYDVYLRTQHWQSLRELHFRLFGRQCQQCGAEGIELHLHHRTYERRGREAPGDLVILCKDCHAAVHGNIRGE
jgi:phage terminase large subunit GpA-like protein